MLADTVTGTDADPDAAAGQSRRVVLSARDISVTYHRSKGAPVQAVDGVSLELRSGETLGLVGESGCGKSSMGRSLVLLPAPTSGQVFLGDIELTALKSRQLRPLRQRVQLIFQDPISSLNPRRTAVDIVAEPLRLMGDPAPHDRALEFLAEVGVDAQMARRRPHELSGGQCQRVSIARAVAQRPDVLICDEPVSALDVSVQARVLNLLQQLRLDLDLSMVFISHDLAVVGNVSDRVAVMYLGRICELAPTTQLLERHLHHYTALLLASVPRPGGTRPDQPRAELADRSRTVGSGCPFAPRCPAASDVCRTTVPELTEVAPDHFLACHHPLGRVGAAPLPGAVSS